MHSVTIELVKLTSKFVGARITYQATGDAGLRRVVKIIIASLYVQNWCQNKVDAIVRAVPTRVGAAASLTW